MGIRETSINRKRPNRIPVAESRNVLTVEGKLDRNAYVPRWVNDVDDRIERFRQAGYDFVKNDGITVGIETADWRGTSDGSIVRKGVGRGVTAYLMAIPKEFYDEDQKKKQKLIDEQEAAMLAAVNEQSNYGKISFSRRNGTVLEAERRKEQANLD